MNIEKRTIAWKGLTLRSVWPKLRAAGVLTGGMVIA